MPAPRSLVFSVRPQTTNIGNDIIAMGTAGLLEVAWPGPVDVVALPSAGPVRGAKSAGLDARNAYEANQLADAVLVGGGNLLENGALHVDATALRALQVPLGMLAISSGRVRGREGRLVARTDWVADERVAAVCTYADPVLVREDATAELLAGFGVEAAVAGCPSLFLDRFCRALPDPDPGLAGTALISVRHPRLMSVPYADQARVQRDVERLLARLGERYDRVALLCHDYQDLAFAAGFAGAEVRYTEDVRDFVAWLRGCAVSVGYRLHGFLACVALEVPAVHISYDERGEAMIATLGVGDHDVPLHTTADVAAGVLDRLATLDGRPPRVDAEAALARMEPALVGGVERLAARAAVARAARASLVR